MQNSSANLRVGNTPVKELDVDVHGELVQIDGEYFYSIKNYEGIPPFFMTLVSPGDQWLFIASNGGMTAGRKNSQSSLFPYYTVDKLIDSTERTGAKSMFRVKKDGQLELWEPFSGRYLGLYSVKRNLYKNKLGNKIIFEEINHDLGLKFSYSWSFSDQHGFVLTHKLRNLGEEELEVEVLSGIQNLLPSGVNPFLQNTQSTLVDAYRKSELEHESGLGIFSLSSIIVDKAEPSEALRANTVWCRGLKDSKVLLSILQFDPFRKGEQLHQEDDVKATKGAFLTNATIQLPAGESRQWCLVAEVDQSVKQVSDLSVELLNNDSLVDEVKESVQKGSHDLWRLVALADGSQTTSHPFTSGRHYSNVLYNIMRGGIFECGYEIIPKDFKAYVKVINHEVSKKHASFFNDIEKGLTYQGLLNKAVDYGDADVYRICTEYLPLSFSRRHGDPSRPWNQFNIEGPDKHGRHRINFEGNWRDIFQNWEALAFSFPAYIRGMVAKFLNASTTDGYNPYRINKNGIDWEVVEPDNPWSFIGYWGDHQIIYLLRLLEHYEKHFPGDLQAYLDRNVFVYANVPYRIKSFEEILEDPKDTIRFDHPLEQKIKDEVSEKGSDGKLIWQQGSLLRANLAEKLLLTGLTKFYNFVPEGGIWMNTQRPEWNDANNALVGNGISMVTLYHLRRYFAFLQKLFNDKSVELNGALHHLAGSISSICEKYKSQLESGFSDQQRLAMLKELGQSGEEYRSAAYNCKMGKNRQLGTEELQGLLSGMLSFLDQAIDRNKRTDGLYHSYNLLNLSEEKASVSYLYEMLEGQVAVLNAGVLSPQKALSLLDTLKKSRLYRTDQYSYLLYPERELPSFLEKNTLPKDFAESSKLIQKLVEDNQGELVEKDRKGQYHFAGDLRNAKEVKKVLKELESSDYSELVKKERSEILEVYERVFNHKAFTGRSGTFFAYEGLGSIYWHMVSKLLLAVQENLLWAHSEDAKNEVCGGLMDHYYEIRAGIGYNKSPKKYGAFPTDAYSHTPKGSGAKQPGMTGQVKEDIINRWAELGLQVKEGRLYLDPFFWNKDEFLNEDELFNYLTKSGDLKQITVEAGEIAFTYCGTLVRFRKSDTEKLSYRYKDELQEADGLYLPDEVSEALFSRSQDLQEIIFEIK